eukprot:scaffold14144_cov91-Skeletonema_dohrnii-CCMP3373.AAC.9
MVMKSLLLFCCTTALLYSPTVVHSMSEEHRLEQRQKHGYAQWPPTVVPNTPGWNRIMNRRFEQISRIRNRDDKWNAWVAIMTSALIATNYTENGWGLTRAPDHITRRLQRRLNRTLLEEGIIDPSGKSTYKEHYIPVIGGEEHARPLMITNAHDNREILNEMTPFFEWWSGIDLKPSIAYGIRAYRNDSNLLMHIDKPTSHVISGIYHVGRSEDAEPWPIVIEDFHGNTNQVYLTPGDILFYESSKCNHGRPQTFYGGYYASLFMHYAPASPDFDGKALLHERDLAVPPHWHVDFPPQDGLDEFEMVGTSFKEPKCKNLLCALDDTSEQSKNTVNWYGPAPKGMIVTNGWDPETMEPPKEWVERGYDGGKRREGNADGIDSDNSGEEEDEL